MATITILDETAVTDVGGVVGGGTVLVDADGFATATGWELQTEGLCRGDVCVPVRGWPGVVVDGRVDAEKVAGPLRRSVVVDADAGVVAYGAAPAAVAATLTDLQAPDFTLPQLDGTPFTFSTIGRKKKLLVTWASW